MARIVRAGGHIGAGQRTQSFEQCAPVLAGGVKGFLEDPELLLGVPLLVLGILGLLLVLTPLELRWPQRSEPAPEPVAVVLTPPDPNRPKRAGWWSRTKAALTGE